MSNIEQLAKQRVPVLYFVPLRILAGIAMLYWSILVFMQNWAAIGVTSATGQLLLAYAVALSLAGILLILGLLTKLGAMLGLLVSYIAYFSVGPIAPAYSALNTASWPLLFTSIVILHWNVGRVLGLDKYVVEKIPFLATIRFA